MRSRPVLGTLAVLSVCWVVPEASAGSGGEPRTLFGHPVKEVEPLSETERARRVEDFERGLAERGWVRIDDQVRPMGPDGGFAQPSDPVADWTTPPHRSTIFLNFFGDTLTSGTNAALNESPCIMGGSLEYPGFSGTEQQALSMLQVFENQMAPYGIRFAYAERPPAHLPYAMVMMGGNPGLLGLPGGVLGVSCSSDCGDFWWRDLTFAFTDSVGNGNAEALGTTALHEAAHAFGLAHVDGSQHIMYPFVNTDVSWAEQCTPYNDSTGGINCQPTHNEFCGGGAQNSHAELLAYFGENTPDLDPPVVEILSPADGSEHEVGASLTVEAEITDNHEGVGWKLVLPEVGQEAVAFGFEKQWPLGNLPQGTYTLRVEAIDHDRNEAFDEVTIYVGVDAPEPGEDTTAGEDTTGSDDDPLPGGTAGSTGEPSDDGSESSGSPDPDQMGDGDEGCGCRTSPTGMPAVGLLVLLGLGLRRRRWPT